MPTESGTLTLLPNGVHEDSGFLPRDDLRVAPSPHRRRQRARPAGELSVVRGLAADARAMRLHHRGGRARSTAVTIDPDALTPDSPTWHMLFDKTKVGDGKFKDLSDTQFPSFPVADDVEVHPRSLHDRVRELPERVPAGHDGTARHPRAGPREHLRGRPAPLLPDARGHGAYRRGSEGSVVAVPRPGRLPGHAGRQPGPVARVHRGAAFPRPPGCRRELSAQKPPPPPPEPPKVDFHGFVAFCGDYPNLMRRLGLAFDVLLEKTQGMNDQGRIRLEVRESPAEWMLAEAARPWTNYEIEDRRFLAASQRSRRRSRRRHAAARMDQPVPGQPDRRRRQFAQDRRLRRQPAADQCAPEGPERPVDDGRRLVAAGVAIERLHGLARRAHAEAGRAARRRRRSRGRAHRRRSRPPTSSPRTSTAATASTSRTRSGPTGGSRCITASATTCSSRTTSRRHHSRARSRPTRAT